MILEIIKGDSLFLYGFQFAACLPYVYEYSYAIISFGQNKLKIKFEFIGVVGEREIGDVISQEEISKSMTQCPYTWMAKLELPNTVRTVRSYENLSIGPPLMLTYLSLVITTKKTPSRKTIF